jgi:hypothetical protein
MPKKKIPREQLIVDFHIRGADTAVLSNTVLPVCLRRKEYCKYHIHIGGTLHFSADFLDVSSLGTGNVATVVAVVLNL